MACSTAPLPTSYDAASAVRTERAKRSISRRAWGNAIVLAIGLSAAIAAVFAVPGLADVADRLDAGDPGWLIAAAALELVSCVGYVVVVQRLFDRVPGRLARRLAWAELGINSLLPAGGLTGLGAGGMALRSRGLSSEWIAERSIVVFLLTSAVNVGAVLLIGVGLGAGVIPGPHSVGLTFFPAAGAGAMIVGVLLVPRATRGPERPGRLHAGMRALAGGVRATLQTLRRDGAATGGAIVWWAFDNAVLLAALYAFGAHPGLAVVAMAYLIGMLGSALPVPGGIGAVDGGLLGALVLYGVPAAPAAAAVLIYRAISLWLPAVAGGLAVIALRRSRQPAGASDRAMV
jgi:uncharacterized membrane protein YbhN (UPF0104 family)